MLSMITQSVVAAILFIALIPGQIVRIPQSGSKMTVAMVHGVVFFFVYLALLMITENISEGFADKVEDDKQKVMDMMKDAMAKTDKDKEATEMMPSKNN